MYNYILINSHLLKVLLQMSDLNWNVFYKFNYVLQHMYVNNNNIPEQLT